MRLKEGMLTTQNSPWGHQTLRNGAYSGFFRSAPYLEKSCSAIHKRELFSRYSKMREEVTLHRSLAFTYDSQDLLYSYTT